MNADNQELLKDNLLKYVSVCFVDTNGQLRSKLVSKKKVLRSIDIDGEGFTIALPSIALGFNDFLFADEAIQNVKAVQKVLDVLDVKGKTYQVEQKFSLDMDKKFNEILQETKGTDANARFSEAFRGRLVRPLFAAMFAFCSPPDLIRSSIF